MKSVHVVWFVGLALTAIGCTSSENPPPASPDAGGVSVPTNDAALPTTDSSAPGTDAGTNEDATTGADAGDDSSTSGDSASNDGALADGGDLCLQVPNGTYKATALACNGTPVSMGNVTWTADLVNGGSSSFTETINGCSLTQGGTATCTGDVLSHTNIATSCSPANCSPFGPTTCSALQGTAYWQITQANGTTFVAQSMDEPDGGPTPIRTCVDMKLQNPVQVTWTKQ